MSDDNLPSADRARAREQRRLLASLLRGPGGERRLTLTFAQLPIWAHVQVEPNTTAYNVPVALRLEGDLDRRALEESLNGVVARHDALRATFSRVPDPPTQTVLPPLPVPLPVVDLSALPAPDREHAAVAHATAEALRPFDLCRGPLLRASLLRLGAAEYVVLLTLHHIACDGWSLGLVTTELMDGYQASAAGRPHQLAPHAARYADYVAFERQQLRGVTLARLLAYWDAQLGGGPPALAFPSARPAQDGVHRLCRYTCTFAAGTCTAVKALARQAKATDFMTLLAAVYALLLAATGQQDIAVATLVANRSHGRFFRTVGLFANTLILRTQLSPCTPFGELLRRVREMALGAYEHQALPLELLLHWLESERGRSRADLCKVLFVFQNAPIPRPALPGLRLTPLFAEDADPESENRVTTFDLIVEVEEADGSFRVNLGYNGRLFEAPGACAAMAKFEEILCHASQRPADALGTIMA
jgi:hypothetical protein